MRDLNRRKDALDKELLAIQREAAVRATTILESPLGSQGLSTLLGVAYHYDITHGGLAEPHVNDVHAHRILRWVLRDVLNLSLREGDIQ